MADGKFTILVTEKLVGPGALLVVGRWGGGRAHFFFF